VCEIAHTNERNERSFFLASFLASLALLWPNDTIAAQTQAASQQQTRPARTSGTLTHTHTSSSRQSQCLRRVARLARSAPAAAANRQRPEQHGGKTALSLVEVCVCSRINDCDFVHCKSSYSPHQCVCESTDTHIHTHKRAVARATLLLRRRPRRFSASFPIRSRMCD